MERVNVKARKAEKGFTLVELAIVMIIIGLLIGGVLKGQELINNAQVAAVVTEIKGFDASINIFRDTYAGYPGDLRAPDDRIQGCDATPCSRAGDGNGRIGANEIYTPTANPSENLSAWAQMEAAGVVSAVDGTATLAYGEGLPQSAFGTGGYQISYHEGGDVAGNQASSGHYLQLALNVAAATAANNGFIAASMAARVDRKMDNGLPTTGSVREVGAAGTCQTAADIYDEANNLATCALVIGMSN